MNNPFKPISISLSPNTEKDDVWLAFKLIFQPWRWKSCSGSYPSNFRPAKAKIKMRTKSSLPEQVIHRKLEENFEKYLGIKHAVAFNSGRSSLMAILESLGLEKGSEVLLQTFTCNAVPNPVIWSGLKPVFIDCDEETFNIDFEDLRRKITPKSKALIIQHTFGLPADMNEILEICRQNGLPSSPQDNLILIEDCAHALGAEYSLIRALTELNRTSLPEAKNKKVGTFGKVAFFSFSRDKIISSVYGGMAVTDDDELAKKLKDYQEKTGYPSYFWIFQQLLHPVLMNWLILPTYSIFGKYILIFFQTFHILSKAVHWKEKRGEKPEYFPKRLPDALAILALNQLNKLERFNLHRREISQFYYDNLKDTGFELPAPPDREVIPINAEKSLNESVFLRFAVKHPDAYEIIKKAWRKNLLIGDWYTTPIAPYDTRLEKIGYKIGDSPKAEKLAKITLNLPTHINISKKEARKIVYFLLSFH